MLTVENRSRYNNPMGKAPSIGIRLEDPEREALERAARADARSISGLGRKIIAEWLAKNGWLKVPSAGRSKGRKH
jgi:hypothetical protein